MRWPQLLVSVPVPVQMLLGPADLLDGQKDERQIIGHHPDHPRNIAFRQKGIRSSGQMRTMLLNGGYGQNSHSIANRRIGKIIAPHIAPERFDHYPSSSGTGPRPDRVTI